MSWQAAVERTVTAMGYQPAGCERSAGGLLRVYIDRRPGDPRGEFVVVEDCEAVTRQLQHVLEVEGVEYRRLEVSSPGLDRPLRSEADYARFAGQPVALTLVAPLQGRKHFSGTLLAPAGEAGRWRLVQEAPAAPRARRGAASAAATVLEFGLAEVREARLVPVLDFKGRRFEPAAAPAAAGGADGGLKR